MKGLVWLITPVVLLIVLIVILIPKNTTSFDGTRITKECDCAGASFWYNSKCIGFPYHCTDQTTIVEECQQLSCEELIEIYTTKNVSKSDINILSSDIIIILDVSNSMLGDKLSAAKQAGISLIHNVREDDRVGIITFSDTALMVNNFSSNTEELIASVEKISVRGGTEYLPPLLLAKELFRNFSTRQVKGIIFLSDGVPSDNPELILSESKRLARLNITLFTISFGIEDDTILSEMTSEDNVITNRRYRSYTTTESITEAFVEAYKELTTLDVIDIQADYSQKELTLDEVNDLRFSTTINTTKITAKPSNYQCIENLITVLYASGHNNSYNITLDSDEEGFSVPPHSLIAGEYDLTLEATVALTGDKECLFYGSKVFNPVTIIDYKPCQPASCAEVNTILQNSALMNTQKVMYPRSKDQAHVAFFVDKSESMELHINDAMKYAQLLDNMLLEHDMRSLTLFSDNSYLTIPFTRGKILEHFETPQLQGTTKFHSVLKKIKNIYPSQSKYRVSFIITDGQFHDSEGEESIIQTMYNISQQDNCIVLIGLGNQLLSNSTLISRIGQAAHSNGCGGYVHSPSEIELKNLLTQLLGGTVTHNKDELYFDSSISDGELRVHIASAVTGLALPLRLPGKCVETPTLNVQVIQDSTLVAQEDISANYQGEYRFTLPELPPGKHSLQLSAQVSNCTAVVSQKEYIILGNAKESPQLVSILIIFLSIGILVTTYEFFKS